MKRSALPALLTTALAALALPAAAATPGGLDPSFGTGGIATVPVAPAAADRFLAAAPGPGGSTYAAGFTNVGGNDTAMVVARLGPDGRPDRAFGRDGVATVNVAPGRAGAELARGVGVQSTGQVVFGGPAESLEPGGDSRDLDVYVARVTPSGAPDPSFGTGGVVRLNLSPGVVTNASTGAFRTDTSWGLTVLPDDKILVSAARGHGTAPDRLDSDLALIRLLPDGRLDPGFGTGGVTIVNTTATVAGATENLVDVPRQTVAQPDGKVVAGFYATGSPGAVLRLARLLADGRLDTTFGTGGIATAPVLGPESTVAEVYDIASQGDSFVVTGYGRRGAAGTVDMYAARFRADGAWDTTFGTNGVTTIDIAGQDDRGRDLTVLPDGRAVLVGSGKPTADNLDALVVVLTRDGQLDTGFGTGGILLTDLGGPSDSLFGVAQTSAGSVVAVGYVGASPSSGDDAAAVRVTTGLATGYRLAAADGGVFAFGDAVFAGSMGGQRLASPVVGLAASPSGRGYWLAAADGGVFAFGDAVFAGSVGGRRLASPVVGLAAFPSGRGYWLAAADGGVFAFGDAVLAGSVGGRRLASPVRAIALG